MNIYRGNEIGQNGKALWDKRRLSDRSQHSSWDTVVGAHPFFLYGTLFLLKGSCPYIVQLEQYWFKAIHYNDLAVRSFQECWAIATIKIKL